MKKENWIWMPHPAHFIGGNDCKFHLATYVGGYIVSTVGEYLPDIAVRKVLAKHRGSTNINKYEEIGHNRLYETMVFKAIKSKHECCPYECDSCWELDFKGYNNPGDATKGHYELCERWSKK